LYNRSVSNETETWYKECWNKYHPMVFRRCMEILHNTENAEDAAQDVFAKFFEKEGSFDIRPEGFGGLFFKMALNTSLNKRRKDKRYACRLYAHATNVSLNRVKDQVKEKDMGTGAIRDMFLTKVESDGFPDDKVGGQVVDRLFVEAVLEEEDEKTRDIYFMRYRDNMTFEEIGEVVELKKDAVRKRLIKLENKIRLILGKDQNDGKK